jgi:hypothetical protein
MSKKHHLHDREFTGEEEYYGEGQKPQQEAPQPELKPFEPYHVQYQIGGLDPVIEEINDLEFRPNPSNTEVLDDLVKKRPHLANKWLMITILRIQRIGK